MKTLTTILITAVLAVWMPVVLFAQSSTQVMDPGAVNTTQQEFFLTEHPERTEKNIPAYARLHMTGTKWDVLWTDRADEIAANTYKGREVPSDWPVHFISDIGESSAWSYHPDAVDAYTHVMQQAILPMNLAGWTKANTYKGREVPSDWPVHFISDAGELNLYQAPTLNQPAYVPAVCTVAGTYSVYADMLGNDCGWNPLVKPESI